MSKQMRWAAFFPFVVLQSIAMGQQTPSGRRHIAPAAGPLGMEERETTASQAVRAELSDLRQQITAQNLSFQVGYTGALDFPLKQITGLVPPADLSAVRQERSLERAGSSVRLLGLATARCSPTARAFDWRQEQGVTPVRDQGDCGTCWAFATYGSFEGSLKIRSGIGADVDTSEQEVLDCNPVGYDCSGGWWAFPHLLSTGTATEAAYPYVAHARTCRHEPAQVFHGADWDYVQSSSISDIKQALCEHGPLAVGVASTRLFQAYVGGVFREPNASKNINHAVTLIGWNDAQRAWVVKNSWSTSWGETAGYGTEKGYMRIAYGSNSIGNGAAWSDASSAIELETDTAWRSIAPLGNRAGTDIFSVGGPWEASKPGWNSALEFDDSDTAGWKNAVVNAAPYKARPDIRFIWSEDPAHNGSQGATPAYFRKRFQLNAKPRMARLTVLANDDALVYINGHLAVNDHDRAMRLQFIDVTAYLQAGWNLIAVKAHDSRGPYEGLYLSLRAGAQELVNSAVKIQLKPGSKRTTASTAGCPANSGYVGQETWTGTLVNLQAAPLSDIFVEVQTLTNDNLFVSARGALLGTGDVLPVEAGMGESYIDGDLGRSETVDIPFTICLKNRNPYQLVVNVVAVK